MGRRDDALSTGNMIAIGVSGGAGAIIGHLKRCSPFSPCRNSHQALFVCLDTRLFTILSGRRNCATDWRKSGHPRIASI